MSAALAAAAFVPAVLAGVAADPAGLHVTATSRRRTAALVAGTAIALAGACLLRFGPGAEALLAASFVSVLVLLSAVDITRRVLPNRIVLPAAATVLAAQAALGPGRGLAALLAAGLAAGFLLAAHIAYPPGLGMGDVKLALLLGAGLGATVAVALAVGLVAAAIAAAALFAVRGGAARRTTLPLGPFLALGAVVAVLAGEQLLGAYLASF